MEHKLPKMFGTTTIGEKGQLVIPVEARKELGLEPGSRVVIMGAPRGKALIVMPAESVEQMMQKMTERLGMMQERLKKGLEND